MVRGEPPRRVPEDAACRLRPAGIPSACDDEPYLAGKGGGPSEVIWTPDAYNLVGFDVDPVAAPTFAQFFAGSAAHAQGKVYRLVDGAWRQVVHTDATAMRSGEAFWIYCDGASRYQGPLRVENPTRMGVVLDTNVGHLVLRNDTGHPVTPTLEHVVNGSNAVPLSMVIQVVGNPAEPVSDVPAPMPDGAWTQPLPPLEAGWAIRVPLKLRSEAMKARVQSSLLRVSTDMGTGNWVPVIGVRDDLESQ